MYFERAYFLAPGKGAIKAYRLLAQSMEDAQRAGIATFVMRGKEYWVAIIAENGLLRAETMRFHDELRSPADVGLPELEAADPAQVRELQESMRALATNTPDRAELSDRQSQRILERVREKLARGEDVMEPPAEEEAEENAEPEQDLMEVLKQSLQQTPPEPAKPRPRRRARRRPSTLARRSKADLYKRAQELGIPGRSGMTKEQLIKAIADAR
jgi:DNA end-binding protein Ku